MDEKPQLEDNEGSIKFCADCYGSIGGMDKYYTLSCGHCYHLDCWNGQCCGWTDLYLYLYNDFVYF